MAKDRWQELCDSVASDDGLPIRDIGAWSEDKLWYWHRYLDITTSAMSGKPQWRAGLVYVDLFAGPGVCGIRDTDRRIPGSPLIACAAPKPFSKLLFVELDPRLAEALERRIATTPVAKQTRVFCGDSNEVIGELSAAIPDRALTLAFVDPEGLDARFETLTTLCNRGQVDLLILFADAYDVVRNVDRYEDQLASKLDVMLGPGSRWRDGWKQLLNRDGTNVREFFAEEYKAQLRDKLGYQAFEHRTIQSRRGPLYRLIYASKHPRSADFWRKISLKDRGGQGDLFGP